DVEIETVPDRFAVVGKIETVAEALGQREQKRELKQLVAHPSPWPAEDRVGIHRPETPKGFSRAWRVVSRCAPAALRSQRSRLGREGERPRPCGCTRRRGRQTQPGRPG